MGVLKVGDAQSYNIISKTESLVISSVFDHRANTYIDPNSAIQRKILDPYHGSYVNNITQETISIDDAMNKNLIIVEQQSSIPHSSHANDKYVISTSLIRETRSYHLLGVRDYLNNRELSVQEAIRLGILDKQNGQYINRKTNEIFSISEAIAQGHIRAQPLPVDGATTSTTTTSNTHETIGGNTNVKRGTVKETKTYTLKSAIHPKTRQEIPIRQGKVPVMKISFSIFRLSLQRSMKASLTMPRASMSIHWQVKPYQLVWRLRNAWSSRSWSINIPDVWRTLSSSSKWSIQWPTIAWVFPKRSEQVWSIRVWQAIIIMWNNDSWLLPKPMTKAICSEDLSIKHRRPSSLITGIKPPTSSRASPMCARRRRTIFPKVKEKALVQEEIRDPRFVSSILAIERKLFDRRRVAYLHPITGDEIHVGEAIKRGLIQVQAVSSQIVDQRSEISSGADSRSKVSIHIESHPSSSTHHPSANARLVSREKDIVEIESIQRVPRHRRHRTTTEEEILEQHTTNVVDEKVYINRGRSSERPRQQHIEEVIIDDGMHRNRRDRIDIEGDRKIIQKHIVIEGDIHRPVPRDQLIIDGTHREHEVQSHGDQLSPQTNRCRVVPCPETMSPLQSSDTSPWPLFKDVC